MEQRLCLDCGQMVVGRIDKKFCNDLCRNNYNNHLKMADASVMKQINGVLKNNRRILAKLNPHGKVKLSRKRLINAGYNFNYITHYYLTQKGDTYYFCYEYGYLPIINDDLLLVKRQEKFF